MKKPATFSLKSDIEAMEAALAKWRSEKEGTNKPKVKAKAKPATKKQVVAKSKAKAKVKSKPAPKKQPKLKAVRRRVPNDGLNEALTSLLGTLNDAIQNQPDNTTQAAAVEPTTTTQNDVVDNTPLTPPTQETQQEPKQSPSDEIPNGLRNRFQGLFG